MPRVFLDANVYFSGSRSPSGGSAVILQLVRLKKLNLSATREVLHEAERNIRQKETMAARLRFYQLLSDAKPKMIEIDRDQAEKNFSNLINRKDTYVLEGAKKAKADFLVTLDKKHFFTQKVHEANLPFQIVFPGDLLQYLSSQLF